MTPPTADPYQRALNVLDEGDFWDRYLTQLPGEAVDIERGATTAESTDETERSSSVVELPTVDAGVSAVRGQRWSRLQRGAMAAAAAAIAVAGGVALLNAADDEQPVEVFVPVVVATATPEPTFVQPAVSPTATAIADPVPQPTSEPVQTPTPEPPQTPEPEPNASSDDDAASEPAASAAEGQDAESEGPESVTPDPEASASAPEETPAAAVPSVIDPDSTPGQVLDVINEVRRDQGLPDVTFSHALSSIAHEQAWALTDGYDTQERDWEVANLLGGVDVEERLPDGWTDWGQHAGQAGGLDTARSQDARRLHAGDFTHVGIASTSGRLTGGTVIIYANYPAGGPAETTIAVRTDQICFAQVADLNRRVRAILDPEFMVASDSRTDAMNSVSLRLCAGAVNDVLASHELDSRYRVSSFVGPTVR